MRARPASSPGIAKRVVEAAAAAARVSHDREKNKHTGGNITAKDLSERSSAAPCVLSIFSGTPLAPAVFFFFFFLVITFKIY